MQERSDSEEKRDEKSRLEPACGKECATIVRTWKHGHIKWARPDLAADAIPCTEMCRFVTLVRSYAHLACYLFEVALGKLAYDMRRAIVL